MIKRKYKETAIRTSYLLVLGLMLAFIGGCKVYSFTGASISPETKTISIKRFPNNAMTVEPTLSQKFTDALRDKFTRETTLVMLDNGGDLRMEGSITQYRTSPVAIQSNETAALNRLTIAVDVTFTNTIDDSQSFKSSFSRYEDYPSTQNLSEVQEVLIDQINEMLVQDIFNKAVVNW